MATAVVCAYSPVGREALEGLLEAGIEVLALYTYPQSADESWFVPPAEVARRAGIPVHMKPRFDADAVFEELRALAPDLLLSFYFREMIQARFLELPSRGAYNLHGSLLPQYRGRAPANWVLVHGERETGVTLHAMTPRPDDGDILGQARLAIDWDETALSLTNRLAALGRALVRETVPRILDGTATRTSQRSLGPSTYFGGRGPEDSRLTFHMSAREAFNQIRAVADPWPNAFLRTCQGDLHLPWALPSPEACPEGYFRVTPEGVLLGFQGGALRLHSLRRGHDRSIRPSEQRAWLLEAGVPEAIDDGGGSTHI
jgi:methionyl-tRNA formyltransferase